MISFSGFTYLIFKNPHFTIEHRHEALKCKEKDTY
jgi:hypothetical protein